jgi:hypothetical protein
MRRPVVGLATAVVVVGSLIAPTVPVAADGGISGCALVTKNEASKILGAKVVKTKNVADKVGTQECTYTTKRFDSAFLEQTGSPLQLVLAWGPIAPTLRGQYEGSKKVKGLGDAAYDLGFGSVVALSGAQSVQATVENSEAPARALAKKARKVIKLALRRLPTS